MSKQQENEMKVITNQERALGIFRSHIFELNISTDYRTKIFNKNLVEFDKAINKKAKKLKSDIEANTKFSEDLRAKMINDLSQLLAALSESLPMKLDTEDNYKFKKGAPKDIRLRPLLEELSLVFKKRNGNTCWQSLYNFLRDQPESDLDVIFESYPLDKEDVLQDKNSLSDFFHNK